MAKSAKPGPEKVTIKKYANRRLYDTESSSYITLDRLGEMIRQGRDFEVVDAKTGEDITHQVLTQIIVDEESRGATLLPVNFLRQLIGMYGGQMQSAVPHYLEAAMEQFQKNQASFRDVFSPTAFADIAKRNMAMFQDAAKAFTGQQAEGGGAGQAAGRGERAAGGEGDELAALKAELSALQAKVEKMGR